MLGGREGLWEVSAASCMNPVLSQSFRCMRISSNTSPEFSHHFNVSLFFSISCDLSGLEDVRGPPSSPNLVEGLAASYALQLSQILASLLLLAPASDPKLPYAAPAPDPKRVPDRGVTSMTTDTAVLGQQQWTLKDAAGRMIACLDACGRLMAVHSYLSRQGY